MLRWYQREAVDELRAAVARSGSALYQLPTGGGKTVVAAEIARLAAAKGSRTLLLVHRRELVAQAVDTLTDAVPDVTVGVEAAGWPSVPWAPLQIGMVQSMARRNTDHVAPDIVIVDEAHHARAKTWANVLERWPGARRIGLTATPQRLDGKGLGEHFAEMVLGPSIPKLVAEGYLAPCRTLTVPVGLDLSGLHSARGEYRKAEVYERYEAAAGAVTAGAADAYVRYAMGRRAIFFGVHREHSRRVCAELVERGVRAEHVDGDDPPARRDRIMGLLRTGGLDVVGNCDLISEGFDAPACEVVMLGAPTRSVTRYLQCAGRAMRPAENKTALVLDLAGISHHLGLPDEEREWSLADGEVVTEQQKKGRDPRQCEQCQTMHYGRACPVCHYEQPMAAVEEVDVGLVAATGRVVDRQRRQRRREEAQARYAPDPEAALLAIAAQRGYKQGWVWHKLRAWGLR